MADTYIDPFETQIYGAFTREQCQEVCLGRIPALDPTIHFVIASQKAADESMAALVEKHKQPVQKPLDASEVTKAASDVIIRFGRHLESHRKGTVDAATFFRGDVPSVLARRRLTKLSGGVRYLVSQLEKNKPTVREADFWLSELTPVRDDLAALEQQQRAARVRRIDLGPEVEAGRQEWLRIYNANKSLMRGLLGHLGKLELFPLLFDDLAEVHRASGVSDELPPGVEPDAGAEVDGAGPAAKSTPNEG